MAVTHFEITDLPDNAIIPRIGSDPLEVGSLYPIDREGELSFSRIPSLDGFYVSGNVGYKAYDEQLGKYGNTAVISLEWKEVDLSVLPSAQSLTETLVNGAEVTLLERLGINGAVEFVEVVSTSGATAAKLNGQNIIPGQQLSPYDLLRSKLEVLLDGGGNPYFSLSYRVGRAGQLEGPLYTYVVNVDTMAALVISVQESYTEMRTGEGGFQTEWVVEESTISIIGGPSLGTASLQVTVDAPFLATEGNTMRIASNNGLEHFAVAAEVFDMEAILSRTGNGSVNITTNIKNDNPGTYAGTVELLLTGTSGQGPVSPENNTVTVVTNL